MRSDLAREHDCRVVVTAAGEKGMPDGADERVANASRMVEAALERGFAVGDLYIDPLVFPISVDSRFGNHCFDAIRTLRARFGDEVHITGGMSNVSFGLPARKLLNEMFVLLAVQAGADGGIMDPVASPPETILAIDRTDPQLQARRGRVDGAGRALHGIYPRLAEEQAQSQVKKRHP